MYTSHGHQIPGTIAETGPRPVVSRCGGIGLCMQCSREAGQHQPKIQQTGSKKMEFTTFVRKPFTVQAVEVTVDNIAEIAKSVGALQYKDDGSPFILVDRDRVPNVLQVSPGFWMTKMGNNIRCYTRKAFYNQFCENTPDIQTWVDFMNNRSEGTEEQAS